jgi:hypothetical protein
LTHFSGRTFDLPSAEITAVVNLVTTFMLLAVVATILMPILSGSVVLVQRRNDEDTTNYDYSDTTNNDVTNDNIDLAGGYYYNTAEQPDDPYAASSDPYNSFYDPNYYANYYNNYYNTNSDSNSASRQLTFGHPSFYLGEWINQATEVFSRASKSIERFKLTNNWLQERLDRSYFFIMLTQLVTLEGSKKVEQLPSSSF